MPCRERQETTASSSTRVSPYLDQLLPARQHVQLRGLLLHVLILLPGPPQGRLDRLFELGLGGAPGLDVQKRLQPLVTLPKRGG